MAGVDVLAPTCDRPAALAATLACLLPQTDAFSRLVVSDQGRSFRASDAREVRAIARLLEFRGAAAVGTPTVGIYWIGNYLSYGSHALAHHRPLVSWQMQCPACGQEAMTQRCMHDVSFVSTVTVGEVLGAAKDLLTIVAPVAHQNLMPTASSR